MYNNLTQLYLHLVWATWDRLPFITSRVEPQLHAALAAKCHELSCLPLAIGGMPDHVHVLLCFPATITVAVIAKNLKGSSSHLMTHTLAPGAEFKWQGSYGAFTVSKSGVAGVIGYIHGQKAHHAAQQLISDLEYCADDVVDDGTEPMRRR
jgi:REP element-mobilizing transposase RayT